MRRIIGSLVAVTLFVPMAFAQSPGEVVSPILACRLEPDDAVRLACFDEAVSDLVDEKTTEVTRADGEVMAPQTPVPAVEPVDAAATFGDEQLPSSRPNPDEVLREVSVRVIQTERAARGKLVFTTENGQVWRQLEADSAEPRLPRSDDPYSAVIRRGSFGSYRLLVEGRRPAVRVRRVQ